MAMPDCREKDLENERDIETGWETDGGGFGVGTEQTGLAQPGITVRTGTAVVAYWKRLFSLFHSSHTRIEI